MKIDTRVITFAKGFSEGFVNAPLDDRMLHIAAGVTAASSLINRDDSLKDTFSKVACAYLWGGIIDGTLEGINSLIPNE